MIMCQLNQAMEPWEEFLRNAWPSDSIDDLDESLSTVSYSIQKIEALLDKLTIRQRTIKVIHHLKESKVDYTLLLYLQLPESLRTKSEVLSYLESTCMQMKADFKQRDFYKCTWDYFNDEGVLPITPDKFITANRKDDILKEYEKIKKSWGTHNPLFIQTYDTKNGKFTNHLYHISRTTQDGILRLQDILKAGEFAINGRVYTACGAFEHVIGPSTLICQIYDCEIMSSAFNERKTTEEIKEMVQQFPRCISSIMIEENLIDIEDFVKFTVKNRTRRINDNDVKISFHFIPNICAPKSIHNAATAVCLKGCKSRIDEGSAAIKNTGLLPESLLSNNISDSLLAFDYSAIKSNGFTTSHSRKNRGDPFPRLIYTEELCGGVSIEREDYHNELQDLESTNMSDKERRMLMYVQLYTVPKHEMLCYTTSAMGTLSSMTVQV